RSGFQTVPYLTSSTSALDRIIGLVGYGTITAISLLGVFLFVKLWSCKNSDPDITTNPGMVSLSSKYSELDSVYSDQPLMRR
ncbi:hypothetical protein DKP78_21385, partial [Enterococcus faecium]